jgi:hypothetical protein
MRDSVKSAGREAAPAAVELHIEELVLTGFAPGDRFHIGDAVQSELARLLGERGMRNFEREPIAVENLDAGRFKVAQGARPQAIGGQIAEKLYHHVAPRKKG